MKNFLKGIVASGVLAVTLLAGATSAEAIYIPTYYVSHGSTAIQNIQTTCHTSGFHSGVQLEYCLHVGVQNQSGSSATYNQFLYATTLWCLNTAGTNVKCSGARVNFTVVADNAEGPDSTTHDVLQCGTYGDGACPTGTTHLSTGWLGTTAALNSNHNSGIQCTTSPWLHSASTSAYVNGYGVAATTTDSWEVCDNTNY